MSKNFEHLIHKNSSVVVDGSPKLPTSGQIEYGEIAINYAKDSETISIKNSNNEIVTFSPDKNLVKKDVFEDKEKVIAMALINLDSRIGEIDVDSFATKEELEEIEFGTATALNDLNDRISSNGDDIDAELTELAQIVEDNEKVTAMALINLNNRVDSNDTQLSEISQNVDEFEEVAARAVIDLNERINAKVSNVQSDWNASSGDAAILNRPNIGNAKIFYGTSSTAAATAIKAVTCPDFTSADLVKGALIFVTFSATNEAAVADIKMNVNSTGDYPIKKVYTNTAPANLNAVGELRANQTYLFCFDSTNWVCLTLDYNTNTTYTKMTQTEANTGTSTTGRSITAAVLKTSILNRLKENQPDWNQTDSTAAGYIKNKPSVVTSPATDASAGITNISNIVYITQSAYNSLQVKDDNTLYVIH